MLANRNDDGTVQLWEMPEGQELRTLTGKPRWGDTLAYTTDDKMLASWVGDSTTLFWNVAEGRALPSHNLW